VIFYTIIILVILLMLFLLLLVLVLIITTTQSQWRTRLGPDGYPLHREHRETAGS